MSAKLSDLNTTATIVLVAVAGFLVYKIVRKTIDTAKSIPDAVAEVAADAATLTKVVVEKAKETATTFYDKLSGHPSSVAPVKSASDVPWSPAMAYSAKDVTSELNWSPSWAYSNTKNLDDPYTGFKLATGTSVFNQTIDSGYPTNMVLK